MARLVEEPARFVNSVATLVAAPIARPPALCYLRGMTSRDSASSEITPEVLLRAYACGIFPMAESADDPTAVLGRAGTARRDSVRRLSRRLPALARTVRSDAFTVTVDTAFKAVIAGCAAPQPGRDDTWINKRIREFYVGLLRASRATATASRSGRKRQSGSAGFYGVSPLGAAPSSARACSTRARDASKVALVHLVARLIAGGFELLDTQYVTEHLQDVRRGRDLAPPLSRAARQGDLWRAGGFPQARRHAAGQRATGALAIIAARN